MTRAEVQPYFRAFMIERGYHDSAEAKNLDFMLWNGERWREFDRATGHKGDTHTSGERDAYGRWLEVRSLDFLAREAVEGVSSSLPARSCERRTGCRDAKQ